MALHPVPLPGPRPPAGAGGPAGAGFLPGLALALLLALLVAPLGPRPARAAGPRAPSARHVPDGDQAALLRQLKQGDVQQRQAALIALADEGDQGAVPGVAAALRDPEPVVRKLAEQALWAIWSRSGDPEVDSMFQVGSTLLAQGLDAQAVVVFTRVIHRAPDFAEGYNKRATAYYEMGAYHRSLQDIAQVLKRNPYHFGALSGAGLCMVALGRLPEALAYFDRALKINPNLDGIRELKREIEKRLHQPLI